MVCFIVKEPFKISLFINFVPTHLYIFVYLRLAIWISIFRFH